MKTENRTYSHLNVEQRCVIRDMVYAGKSAREIARELNVSASTIVREIKRNRIIKIPKIRKSNISIYCKKFETCSHKGDLCDNCLSEYTLCQRCKLRECNYLCKDFEIKLCPLTSRWPYICTTACTRRNSCRLPKCSYNGTKADENYRKILVERRAKISISSEKLKALEDIVIPLLKQGNSPYVIFEEHKDLPIGARTFYSYVAKGLIDITSLDLPRKARRKTSNNNNKKKRDKIDRTSREFKDYLLLSEYDKKRTMQLDTVFGLKKNKQTIFSIHSVAHKFQFYNLLSENTAKNIVAILDMYELYLGSTEEFEKIFGILLADRGSEFDLIEGIERSVFDRFKKRCKLFFCDPNRPDQKGSCENNHEHLRRILEKEHSNFDALSNFDVALLNSHVNSYKRKSLGGISPFESIIKMIPKDFLDALGIEFVEPDNVVLKPSLLRHVIC